MRVAIVGCGYVAGFYLKTFSLYPELKLVGATDSDSERAAQFTCYYGLPHYRSLDTLLADKSVDIVLNLTNPRSHFAVSQAALLAGKHVYTEKPLAMSLSEAKELVSLAASRGLRIASAPSRILAAPAQTMWKAIRQGVIGKVRLVYAEMDDGLVHRMAYKSWLSDAGAPWPYQDEFEIGCTAEHAGYSLTWLLAFFGPAESITAFASCQIPDKQPDVPIDKMGPDFSVACIQFASGVVARLTCSLVAPSDHSIRIFGDDGILSINDCWKPRESVYVHKRINLLGRAVTPPWGKRYPLLKDPRPQLRDRRFKKVDFCLGLSELAEAITQNRSCRLSAEYCLHATEIVLAIHNAAKTEMPYKLQSSFAPMAPMPWANG